MLIRQQRDQKGWSQEDLAATLGQYGVRWYQSTVNRVESGGRTVTWDEAIVICAALGIDLVQAAKGDLDYARATRQRLEAQLQSLDQQRRDAQQQLANAKQKEHEATVRAFADLPDHLTVHELRGSALGSTTGRQVKSTRARQGNR